MRRADRKCHFHGHVVTYPSSVIDSHLRLVNATFPTEGKAFGESEQTSPPKVRANNDADSRGRLSLQIWWVIVCLCEAVR